MTKSSSLDGPVMKLIEFVKVESIEMEKQCQNLSYPTRFPWTSCNVVLIILSTKSIRFHQSWCTISVFGHVQEISVNTDWNFVFSVLRLWKMDENDPVPVSSQQSTSFFCFYCFGFFLLSLSDLWIFSIPATATKRSPPDCSRSINPKVKNQHGIYEQNCLVPPPHFCFILAAMLKQVLKMWWGKVCRGPASTLFLSREK